MNHRRLLLAATIIALFIVGGFVLSVPHTRDVTLTSTPSVATSSVPHITLRDVFKKGTHTISGTVVAPNACTAVNTHVSLDGAASSTQNILLEIALPPDSGICLQVPTSIPFQTTLAAPAHLPITVTVNGTLATTTAP